MMEKAPCPICNGGVYYLDMAGLWQLCPRCDVLRIADAIRKVK